MRLFSTDHGIARDEADGTFALLDLRYPDVGELLRHADTATAAAAPVLRRMATLDEVAVLAPIVAPGRFVIVGLNFRSHVDEFSEGLQIEPNYDVGDPFVFDLPGSPVCGPGDTIVRPPEAPDQVDYEGEVAVIIGQAASEVSPADAWSLVAGLSAVNDVSARDVQTAAMTSATPGIGGSKSFPTFKPLGPCLTTADRYTADLDVGITTLVNGELRQDGRTTEFLTPLPELLSFISHRMALQPGDVICTGSPRGVGMWTGGRWLQPGDVVAVTVEGVGTLTNSVA
jgi:2-keto-4-pentenoate hydratase/2-oxohepta-3-ene-1,7-dioic acid hydratase in catechol pathway